MQFRGKLARSIVFATSASVAAIAISTPAIAGDIAGTVVDASGTIALGSAQVRIVELKRVAITERDGRYLFADVPAGTYTLEIRYVGADTVRKTIEVPATGTAYLDVALGGDDVRQILVLGQRATQASALSRKREADGVSDVLTRDAIGQFPDQNVAESLRRLPGINVLNDQGEGRFVSVRGLDKELNSTSLNGVRIPAPEGDTRAVALDVISSDIIESIEIKKSLTPDMDADTIGASIEIETTSAFDRKKSLLTAKLEGSYNDYADHLSPKGSIDFATRLGENVGISGGFSYYKRKFETDNIEADGWNADNDAGVIFAEELQYRDYDVERERISATLGLDFRVGDNTELYVKGLFSQFDDQEYRRRTTFDFGDFDDDGPSDGDSTTALFSDADQEFTVERDIKDRFERQRIRSLTFGGKTDTGDWFAEYAASWAKSSEKENGSVDPAQFERDFEDDGLSVLVDYSNPRTPLYSIPSGMDVFTDPSGYELNDIEYVSLSDSQDEEFALKLDLGREFAFDTGTFTIQAGAKARWREKTYNKTVEFYENDDLTLADALGSQTYRITDIGPVASYRGATDYFNANFGDFELQEDDSFFDSALEDYRADEDVIAGYLLGRWENDRLRVIGGVRYEHTDTKLVGNAVDEEGPTATEIEFDRTYDHWLPSLNIRFEPVSNIVLRAAGYRSLVRPKLSDFVPNVEINEDDEAEFGNPNLKPYEAWNIDLSAEYYFASNGAITGGFFYKDIKNYIVDVTIEDAGVFNDIGFEEAVIPINGPSAEIFGFELSYSQAFTMLPAPFDGLLAQVNYTYTDATGKVADGDFTDLGSIDTFREIPLPETSKHTINAAIGYDKGPISLRLSGTYRDKYLDELAGDPEEDRYVDDHFQLDLSAKFRVTDNVQLFYEWININDAEYFAYNNVGGRRNLYQYERYNWTMKFGTKVNF